MEGCVSSKSDEPKVAGTAGKIQSLTAEDLLRNAGNWTLVSGPGQPLELAYDMRRNLAIFKEGIAIVRTDCRHMPAVRMALQRAEHLGLSQKGIFEASAEVIEQIYARSLGNRPAAASWNVLAKNRPPEEEDHVRKLDLERQKSLARVVASAARMQASDIHMRVLDNATEIKFRINGRMRDFSSVGSLEGQEMIRAAFAVASGQGATGTDSTFQQGAMFQKSGLLPSSVEMLRLQYTPTSDFRGALVMRLKYVSKDIETDVDSLGYSDEQAADLRKMRLKTNGMYIFAGKVSSGKTTTLQRCLNAMYLDKRKEITIYAAEDPRELELFGAVQAQISAGKAADDAFKMAMKAALRSDPNVIVLGEIRSEELTAMAIEAAKTGHALWSTVHAGSALGILNRLINLGADREDLKDPKTVGGLIYQRLLGVMCPHCRLTFAQAVANGMLDPELAERFMKLSGQPADRLYVRGPGCPQCFMGLTGRTVVAETIRPDTHLLELYMGDSRSKAERYWLTPRDEGGLGGSPVLHHALVKAAAGIVDINEVEEEVDLVENYERELGQLVTRLRRDIADLQSKGSKR
jgi:general secretion pathway protein E